MELNRTEVYSYFNQQIPYIFNASIPITDTIFLFFEQKMLSKLDGLRENGPMTLAISHGLASPEPGHQHL